MASPWLDTRAAAEFVCCTHRIGPRAGEPNRRAFRQFARRHGIVFRYAGAKVLVARADLERLIEDRRAPRRRTNGTSVMTESVSRRPSARQ